MSFCKKEGKDHIVFVTEEDHNSPSKVDFPEEDEDDKPAGLVLPNGEINWGCPCLGGMATGPCGVEFREAFTCFHNSKADPKGSDCLTPFRTMSECMSNFPGVYGGKDKDNDEDEELEALDDESEVKHIKSGTNPSGLADLVKSKS